MQKILIYQLFVRIFGNRNTTNQFYGSLKENGTGKFDDINTAALKSLRKMGFSHIWYTGVIEHATMEDFSEYGIAKDHPQVVKGRAGSPYAIKDYYDVNPNLANDVKNRMNEFEALVARTHQEGMKVIIDFVPNHVARQYHSDARPAGVADFGQMDDTDLSFSPWNNFYYIPDKPFVVPDGVNPPVSFSDGYREYPAKATGNGVFFAKPTHNDWYETVKINYGVDYLNRGNRHFEPIPNTWNQMLDILLFWAGKGVDGFRCDMAEMVPVEFWHWVTARVKELYPEVIFIAEIYNPHAYRKYIEYGGFDYLYDKVGLYDSLRRLIEGHGNAMDITRVWQQESGEFAWHMLRFLENHDEQRIASDFFGKTPESAFAAMMLSATLHDGPLMIYNGQELGVKPDRAEGFSGNDGRTTIFDFWGLEEMQGWINEGKFTENTIESGRKKIRDFYKKLLHFTKDNEAVTAGQFHDLQYLNGFWQSEGYDERCLYSYLRYTEKQMLLFVYNFDLNHARKFKLRLPLSLFEGKDKLEWNQVFEGKEKIEVELKEDLLEFELEVKANGFKVFELG